MKKCLTWLAAVSLCVSALGTPLNHATLTTTAHLQTAFQEEALVSPLLSPLRTISGIRSRLGYGTLLAAFVLGLPPGIAAQVQPPATPSASPPAAVLPAEMGRPTSPEFQMLTSSYLNSLHALFLKKMGPDNSATLAVQEFRDMAAKSLVVHPELGSLVWDVTSIGGTIENVDIAAVGLNEVKFREALDYRFPTSPTNPVIANVVIIKEGSSITRMKDDPQFHQDIFQSLIHFDTRQKEGFKWTPAIAADREKGAHVRFIRTLVNDLVDLEAYGYTIAFNYLENQVPFGLLQEAADRSPNTAVGQTVRAYAVRAGMSSYDLRESILQNEIALTYPDILRALADTLGTAINSDGTMKITGAVRKELKSFIGPRDRSTMIQISKEKTPQILPGGAAKQMQFIPQFPLRRNFRPRKSILGRSA